MKLVQTKFYIRAFRVGKPFPRFACKGSRSGKWNFFEGEENITYYTDEREVVRVARYIEKTWHSHGYERFEIVRVEVIHRDSVIWPKPDAVAKLAQLAPAVYDPPVPEKMRATP